MEILFGGILLLIGMSLGWLMAQFIVRRRLQGAIQKHQLLRETLQERNARIYILQKKIKDRDVVIGNMRALIRNHERVINELKELVQDRLALLRLLEKRKNGPKNHIKVIGSDSTPADDVGDWVEHNPPQDSLVLEDYTQLGSGEIQSWETLLDEGETEEINDNLEE